MKLVFIMYIDHDGGCSAEKGDQQRSCGVCSASWICESKCIIL